jgi:transcriptional regulator with XRE-family HTH domain
MAVMSVEPNFVKIGQNIKIMRIRKGVTKSELAKKLGISQTHMSNLEHGRVSVNLKVLLRLSHYFSCGVDALLGLTLNTEVKPQEAEDKYTAEELLDILKVLKKQTI